MAYLHLPRASTDRSVSCEKVSGGFVVDYTADGRAIGVELTTPTRVDRSRLNAVLERLGQPPVSREDLAPLSAAGAKARRADSPPGQSGIEWTVPASSSVTRYTPGIGSH